MRTQLALAGLVAGVAASFAAPSASAYCEPEVIVIEGGSSGGCRNSCVENGERYENAREKFDKTGALPSYWDIFLCPM